jgi:hypothetical protein
MLQAGVGASSSSMHGPVLPPYTELRAKLSTKTTMCGGKLFIDSGGDLIPHHLWIAVKENASAYYHWPNVKGEIELNPSWSVHICDNAEKDGFMAEFFNGTSLLWAYDAIDSTIAGAAKADIWRYAALYVIGGVYIDSDAQLTKPLSQVCPTFTASPRRPVCMCFGPLVVIPPSHPISLDRSFARRTSFSAPSSSTTSTETGAYPPSSQPLLYQPPSLLPPPSLPLPLPRLSPALHRRCYNPICEFATMNTFRAHPWAKGVNFFKGCAPHCPHVWHPIHSTPAAFKNALLTSPFPLVVVFCPWSDLCVQALRDQLVPDDGPEAPLLPRRLGELHQARQGACVPYLLTHLAPI